MRIDLTNYNAMPTSVFRIYRSYMQFTADKLPEPLVELPATATEYYDNTVELNRIVYYRISVVHGNVETVGNMYTTVRKYFTGPHVNLTRAEPDMILRGNARCGRYGTMAMANVYPSAQIPEDFPTLTIVPGVDVDATKVEKCIFNDKVLFIPRVPLYIGSLSKLYQAGVLFDAVDGDGASRMTPALYSSIANKVPQGKLVHAKNYTYRIRLLTTEEYNDVYVKLFPSSKLGSTQAVSIGNVQPHTDETITLNRTTKVAAIDNPTIRLNGQVGKIEWVKDAPLMLILELVNRADSAFPEPEVVIHDARLDANMQFCGGELVNDRVHFFGGITTSIGSNIPARTIHISYDLNGYDKQTHADMPTGVYSPITWVHANKIYCFGGYTVSGSNIIYAGTPYSGVQVWEDDGTPTGKWIVMETNIPYSQGATGTVYFDTEKSVEYILIMGGYPNAIPNTSSMYYYAPTNNFTGEFSNGSAFLGSYTSGGVIKTYDGTLMVAIMNSDPNTYSTTLSSFDLPLNPPNFIYPMQVKTQGSELEPCRGGKMHIWRDTLLLFPTQLNIDEGGAMYFYQWAPQEFRWLKIRLPYDARGKPTTVFNGKRIYQLISPNPYGSLVIIDLVDPTDALLMPINVLRITAERIYAPYFEVSES